MDTTRSAIQARDYQVELYERALKQNTIIVLSTGSGKTYISVMVLNQMHTNGKYSVFLAPTRPLARQQFDYIRSHSHLRISLLCGSESDMRRFDVSFWQNLLAKSDVIVMTPVVFSDGLQHNFLRFHEISVLVFDECHRAVMRRSSNSFPYAIAMEYYQAAQSRGQLVPRVLGLTASLSNGALYKVADLGRAVTEMETVLCGRVVTASGLGASTAPRALVHTFVYDDKFSRALISRVGISDARFDELCLRKAEFREKLSSLRATFTLPSDVSAKKENQEVLLLASLARIFVHAKDAFDELGTFACVLFLSRVARNLRNSLSNELLNAKRTILKQALAHVRSVLAYARHALLASFDFDPFDKAVGSGADVKTRWSSRFYEWISLFCTPKLSRLLAILEEELGKNQPIRENPATNGANIDEDGRKVACLVFVELRAFAMLIARVLSFVAMTFKSSPLNRLRADFVIGHGSMLASRRFDVASRMLVRKQMAAISAFRNGSTNTLVCTSVLEEGIDVPSCNLVVEFDFPNDFRRFVQAKGRARAQQARFVLLVSRAQENLKKSTLSLYEALEKELFKKCELLAEEPEKVSEEEAGVTSENEQRMDDDCAELSERNALTVLELYCSHLPRDSYTRCSPRYSFETNPTSKLTRCCIKLPTSCALRSEFVGNWKPSAVAAKRDAALKACQLLLEHNELDRHHLTPSISALPNDVADSANIGDVEESNDDEADLDCLDDLQTRDQSVRDGRSPKAGTRSMQRYHSVRWPAVLRSSCPVAGEACFMFELVCEPHNPRYSSCFALLSRTQIPELPAFLLYPEVGVKLAISLRRTRNTVKLTHEQLDQCLRFHRALFESVLRVATSRLNFAPNDSPFGLLIVPCRVDANQNQGDIDWPAVHELNRSAAEHPSGWKPAAICNQSETGSKFVFDERLFTDCLVRRGYAKDKQFSKITSECVVDYSLSPASRLDPNNPTTVGEYLQQIYGVRLTCQDPPMLDCTGRQMEGNLSLITDRWSQETSKQKKLKLDAKLESGSTGRRVLLPPEACEVLIVRASFFRAARLLPSILYRVESLLRADEFRHSVLQKFAPGSCQDHVDHSCFDSQVSLRSLPSDSRKPLPECACRMLQAITSKAAMDIFDFEVFETVGDSFLKWITSANLFARYPISNEGKLSALRSRYVSNLNLLRRGFQKRMPDAIINRVWEVKVLFNPTWLPPLYSSSVAAKTIETVEFADNADCGITAYLDPASAPASLAQENEEVRRQLEELKALLQTSCVEASKIAPVAQLPNEKTREKEDDLDEYSFQLISDKTVADSVESLIGYVLLAVGDEVARKCLQWLHLPAAQVIISSDLLNAVVPKSVSALETVQRMIKMINASGIQDQIGYRFREPLLLLQALTHASFDLAELGSYERLEFLGDALLDYLITRELLRRTAGQLITPGQLTDMRSALVSNDTFARIAVQNNYHRVLSHKSFDLGIEIDRFQVYFDNFIVPDYRADQGYVTGSDSEANADNSETEDDPETNNQPLDPLAMMLFVDIHPHAAAPSNTTVDTDTALTLADSCELDELDEMLFGVGVSSSSRATMTQLEFSDSGAVIGLEVEPPKVLADIFESVAGAIYLDSGGDMDTVWQVYQRLMHVDIESCVKNRPRNAIREVYERMNSSSCTFEVFDLPLDRALRALSTKRCKLTISPAQDGGADQNAEKKVFYGDGFNPRSARKAAARAALKDFYGDSYRHRNFI